VAHGTNALMREMVDSGEVDELVAERVWTEMEGALGEAQPSRFIEVLRACGALQKLFPEIEALFGVPQPAAHHPEVDTGEHILLVIDQAAKLSRDPQVVFAALVHDFGKGATPPADWPRHIGHEGKGADMVKAFCNRFRVPNEYRDLGVLTAKYHTHCHRARELKPSTMLRTLESMDAFRKPKRVYKFVLACEADSRGRKGFEDTDYPEGRLFQAAYEAAAAVDSSAIARELQTLDVQGEDIGKAIHAQRLKVVQQVLKAGV
jgi:tRNA nucleotidyltransferase (CCA-adding enzyme)